MQSFPHSLSDSSIVETDIPARLDRLPWGRFHTRVVVALGITWILDGLEVTLAGALSGALKESPVLEFTNADVGIASSAYLAGAVLGAVFFGWLTDRLGRKRLFFITLAVYLVATAATAFSWSLASFILFRFLTGAGIGGEYTAINSTIQELVPARYRGWTDLVINGSFWVGAAIGAGASIGFWIPESPRWLVIHGRPAEAQLIIAGIEEGFRRRGVMLGEESLPRIRLRLCLCAGIPFPRSSNGSSSTAPAPSVICSKQRRSRDG
jgi:MFS family permease